MMNQEVLFMNILHILPNTLYEKNIIPAHLWLFCVTKISFPHPRLWNLILLCNINRRFSGVLIRLNSRQQIRTAPSWGSPLLRVWVLRETSAAWKCRTWGKRCRRHLSAQVADLAQQIGATRRPIFSAPTSVGSVCGDCYFLHASEWEFESLSPPFRAEILRFQLFFCFCYY